MLANLLDLLVGEPAAWVFNICALAPSSAGWPMQMLAVGRGLIYWDLFRDQTLALQ